MEEFNAAKHFYSNKNDRHFIVSCEIYPFDIFCYFGDNQEIINESLKNYVKSEVITQEECDKLIAYDFTNTVEGCFVMNNETNLCVLFIKNLPNSVHNLTVLNHEIFHTTTEILSKVGLNYSHETSEAFAYFLQYLSGCIYENVGLIPTVIQEVEDTQ